MMSFLKITGWWLAALVFCAPVWSQPAVISVKKWVTPTGTAVWYYPRTHLPMVDIAVVLRAGSAFDQQHPGVAMLTTRMLNQGADSMTADQIAQQFDRCGASYAAVADKDKAVVQLRSLSAARYLDSALTLFQKVLTAPDFKTADFRRLRQLQMYSEKKIQSDPGLVALEHMYTVLYQQHPYGHPVNGTVNDTKKLTVQMVRDFYKKMYVAKNAVIVIVGNVSLKKAHRIAALISHNMGTGPAAKGLKLAARPRAQQKMIEAPVNQSAVLIGALGVTPHSADYYNLVLANYILGGGMQSILFDILRNRQGLTYGAFSKFYAMQYRGPFLLSLSTRTNKRDKALAVAWQALHDYVRKGPTAAQVSNAKKELSARWPVLLSANSDLLKYAIFVAFYDLPMNFLSDYINHIRAVTPPSAHQALKKYLSLSMLSTVVVGEKVA